MKSKNDYRIYAKELRKELNIATISTQLINLIRDNEFYIRANNVMLFYPLKYEFNFLDLLNDNKNFYFPKVNNNDLLVCPYKQKEELKLSKLKIYEPCSNPIDKQNLDLIIVPALLVDKQNYRLGYGKGFYDRFLENCNAKTIVGISKELVIDKLPISSHDKKIDKIIIA